MNLLGKDIDIGDGSNVEDHAYLDATLGRILIGRRCRVHRYAVIDARGGFIEVGDDTWLEPYSVVFGQGGVTIGEDCAISPHATIAAYNHAWPEVGLKETKKGILIEDHVWLGAGAIVCDGVRIGKNSVIGAGSVVTHDIPPFSVAYGNPCRPRS